MPRHYNAAWNIKLRGIEMVGWGTPEPNFLYVGKLNTLAEIRTSILDIDNPDYVLPVVQESSGFSRREYQKIANFIDIKDL